MTGFTSGEIECFASCVGNVPQQLRTYSAGPGALGCPGCLKLKEPYGLVLESIGKPSSLVPFMMQRRLAETPPNQQIKEQIGSGPFKFVQAEF